MRSGSEDSDSPELEADEEVSGATERMLRTRCKSVGTCERMSQSGPVETFSLIERTKRYHSAQRRVAQELLLLLKISRMNALRGTSPF